MCQPARASRADVSPNESSGYPCTVLLVDPDPVAAHAAMSLLEADGCTVFPVSSFATAVHLIDVIVTSVILFDPAAQAAPVDTFGFAALMQRTAGVPVILFTAANITEWQARAAGFAALVRKPYDAAALIDTVRAAARLAAGYHGPSRRAPRGMRSEFGR